MRYFIQQIILAAVTFYLTAFLFSGLVIGGLYSYVYSAFLLILGYSFLRPIIQTITLPIAALTFNITTFLSTLIIVFLISLLNPLFSVQPFTFAGFSVFGYTLPAFQANIILSYLIISVTIHIIYKVLYYIFDL